jgi:hypothetical protein
MLLSGAVVDRRRVKRAVAPDARLSNSFAKKRGSIVKLEPEYGLLLVILTEPRPNGRRYHES